MLRRSTLRVEYIPEPEGGRLASNRPGGFTEWRVVEDNVTIGRYNTKKRAKEVAKKQSRQGDRVVIETKDGSITSDRIVR